ncbi:hypothetical protein Dimus_032544 [Dionaea muscipula]
MVMEENGGKPYTNELFAQFREEATKRCQQEEKFGSLDLKGIEELKQQLYRSHEEQIKKMLAVKLEETNKMLEKQLSIEEEARLRAEESARAAQEKSNEEICALKGNLENAHRETSRPSESTWTMAVCYHVSH